MLSKLRRKWHAFKALPAGERFQTIHQQRAHAPVWVKAIMIGGAVVAFGIGVVLTVMPGPAIVFFALAGALAAIESQRVALGLDRGEELVRGLIARWHHRRRLGRR